MTISWFLFVTFVLLLLFLICAAIYGRDAKLEYEKRRRIAFCLIGIFLLALLVPSTVKKYMYPDESVFNNADYHVVKHLGFNVRAPFSLVNSEGCPTDALFDEKEGTVVLDNNGGVTLSASSFFEPLYTGTEKESHLLNLYYDNDVDSGFVLTENGNPLFTLEIVPFEKNKCYYIFSFGNSSKKDTSDFNKLIHKGYPVYSIVASTPEVSIPESLVTLLEGSSLVRETYGDASSPLVLMPSPVMAYNPEISVNNVAANVDQEFRKGMPSHSVVFVGFGAQQTKKIFLDTLPNGCISLRYQMPAMQKLRNQSGRILLTSSVNVISNNLNDSVSFDKQDGVYLYSIFADEDNLNHCHGRLQYAVGDAETDMLFELHDYKDTWGVQTDTISSDQEFSLQTTGSDLKTEREWVFSISDLRETNYISYSKILWSVFAFLFCVCLRVLSDLWLSEKDRKIFGNNKIRYTSLSFFEMGVYVVILSFAVTRLIILWRSSTFVPFDVSGISSYGYMRDSNHLNFLVTPIVCCAIPLLMAGSAVFDKSKSESKVVSTRWIQFFLIYILLMAFCWVCGKYVPVSWLTRISNIVFPMLLYMAFDGWIIRTVENGERSTGSGKRKTIFDQFFESLGWERPLLLLITIGAFFMTDSGFAAIFFLFALFRFALSLLVSELVQSQFWRVFWWIAMLAVTFGFIVSEGHIISWCIDNLLLVLPVLVVMVGIFFLLTAWRKPPVYGRLLFIAVMVLIALCTLIPKVQNKVAEKGNVMKFRAEVQKLGKGEDISALMTQYDFNSSDVTLIMRSAQNQWFLNSYLDAHNKLDNYFRLQPHSNHGSPYNTQTTDVVVTRYVKAEHRGLIVELMLGMMILLILIYCNEINIYGKKGQIGRLRLSGVLFMFVVALSVYMSATNRCVFMGQDFPFLSLQSKVAVILPCLLMFFAARHVMLVMQGTDKLGNVSAMCEGERYVSTSKKNSKQLKVNVPLWTFVGLLFFAACCYMVNPKGADQSGDQFDISKIIDDVSQRVDALNASFEDVQYANRHLRKCSIDSAWNFFKCNAPDLWNDAIDSTNADNRFFASLMTYFDGRQDDKGDPEKLVHITKRNGLYSLRVNRHFYFIEGIFDKADPWTGDILAAQIQPMFSLSNVKNPNRRQDMNGTYDFETNILRSEIGDSAARFVTVLRFDSTWSADHKPLLLISTIPNKEGQYYDIESEEFVYDGRALSQQMATRIMLNDVVSVNQKMDKRGTRNIATFRYGQDNSRYIAKNLWINGQRQLFYPLGKESMWSYQFANLVKNVYGSDTSLRHRSIRISIDYDLHKRMYAIIDSMNKSVVSMDANLRDNLTRFVNEPSREKNKYYIFFDENARRFRGNNLYTRKASVNKVVNLLNKELAKVRHTEIDAIVADSVLGNVLRQQYAFSAVAIDGNGRIRLMLDHTGSGRKIDPNNIRHYNKFISDMYRNGSNVVEREVLGNLAIQHLRPGPGSTFKPIVYSAVTSTQFLDWDKINMSPDGVDQALYEPKKGEKLPNNLNKRYAWYGGIQASHPEMGVKYFSIDGDSSGLNNNDYIVFSNNRYHSLVVLLGMQRPGKVLDIIGPQVSGKEGFPQFVQGGVQHSFVGDRWWSNMKNMEAGGSILEKGLHVNYGIDVHFQGFGSHNNYANLYGQDSSITVLFNQKHYPIAWVFPERATMRFDLRNTTPIISNAFIQMVSGSSPLAISPLQMAVCAMRLATLNSSKYITTLSDDVSEPSTSFYEDFEYDTQWGSLSDYFSFYKTNVLAQMRQVPIKGTARSLKSLSNDLEKQGLYLYCKTGTLNQDGGGEDSRIRHLMVIIANTELENANSVDELRKAKYYVLYLSFRNVNTKEGFSNANFGPYIKSVVDSKLFKEYMNGD